MLAADPGPTELHSTQCQVLTASCAGSDDSLTVILELNDNCCNPSGETASRSGLLAGFLTPSLSPPHVELSPGLSVPGHQRSLSGCPSSVACALCSPTVFLCSGLKLDTGTQRLSCPASCKILTCHGACQPGAHYSPAALCPLLLSPPLVNRWEKDRFTGPSRRPPPRADSLPGFAVSQLVTSALLCLPCHS